MSAKSEIFFQQEKMSFPTLPLLERTFEVRWDYFSKSPYSVEIQKDTDQRKLRIWTLFTQCIFLRKKPLKNKSTSNGFQQCKLI